MFVTLPSRLRCSADASDSLSSLIGRFRSGGSRACSTTAMTSKMKVCRSNPRSKVFGQIEEAVRLVDSTA